LALDMDGVPQVTQFNVNAGRMVLAASAMFGIGVAYYLALRSRALARGPWLVRPPTHPSPRHRIS